jgi:hypothetical protein
MKYLSAILLICIAMASQAQRIELGVFGGGSYYMGDLNPKRPFELTQPAFGFVYRYNFHNRIALKASLTRGKVIGDDLITKYREERAINFESNINELAAVMEFNFFEYFTGSSRSFITPYIFGGLGVFTFEPKATYNNFTYTLRNEKTEIIDTLRTKAKNYSPVAISFPFGIGVKYSVNNVIGITLEWGMRKTTTDYLDDVSTVYPSDVNGNPDDPSPYPPFDPSGNYSAGMQRGNSKDNDWYSFAGVSVIFRINFRGKAGCDEPDRMRL